MKDKQKSGSRHQERRARAAGYINELFACVEMGRGKRESAEGVTGVKAFIFAWHFMRITHTHCYTHA